MTVRREVSPARVSASIVGFFFIRAANISLCDHLPARRYSVRAAIRDCHHSPWLAWAVNLEWGKFSPNPLTFKTTRPSVNLDFDPYTIGISLVPPKAFHFDGDGYGHGFARHFRSHDGSIILKSGACAAKWPDPALKRTLNQWHCVCWLRAG